MPIPRKRFGQHFLRDQAVIQKILAALNPKPKEHLVEIGPGQGALTLPVLKKAKQLEVVELDRDLIPELEDRCLGQGELKIYLGDALAFDFGELKQDGCLLRIFGNLPYNISTPLIFHLLSFAPIVEDMVFMLQKEVGERLAAKADDEHYGRLSVMVQYHCKVELLFHVSKEAFYPVPKVESSILRLLPYRTYPFLAKDYALFEAIVRQAFGMRRKTLRNSLKKVVKEEVWEKLSISSNLRAENLTVKDFVEIANACQLTP